MPNDVITLKAIAYELNNLLCDGRIEKVHQPETDEITLNIKINRRIQTLVISANPSHPRMHITSQKKENSYVAPAFCMLLRKYLTGGLIEKIDIFNNDRIIMVTLSVQNEMKDLTKYNLIVELMGRYSNIILTSSDFIIIDAIKRINFDQSTTRYILPKLQYVLQEQTRVTFDNIPKIKEILSSPISTEELIKKIGGVSKETAFEISSSKEPFITIQNLININKTDNYKPCLRYQNNVPVDYYVMPYRSIAGEYKFFNTLNEALDNFYTLYDGLERKKASTKTLTLNLKRLQNKIHRRINDNLAKIEEVEKAEEYKKYGELILSNIYNIKKHDNSIACYDYYEDKNIEIPLDNSLTAAQNAQNYFKKYSKLKRAGEIAVKQLEELEKQKDYLSTIEVCIQNCSLKSEYDEINEELNSLMGIKRINSSSFKKEKPSKPLHFMIDDCEIFIGKNNIQNNEVTFKIGNNGDIWFHAKGVPGSHLILKGVPNEDILNKCASTVAFYSSVRNSEKVEVDYTLRKNVKKIPSALPGMVTYTNYKSILVTPKDFSN